MTTNPTVQVIFNAILTINAIDLIGKSTADLWTLQRIGHLIADEQDLHEVTVDLHHALEWVRPENIPCKHRAFFNEFLSLHWEAAIDLFRDNHATVTA